MKGGENKQYLSVLGCFRSIVRALLLFNHSARLIKALTLSTLKEREKNTKLVNSGVALQARIMCGMHVLRSAHVFWSSLDFDGTSLRPDREILSCVPCLVPLTPSLSRNMPLPRARSHFSPYHRIKATSPAPSGEKRGRGGTRGYFSSISQTMYSISSYRRNKWTEPMW